MTKTEQMFGNLFSIQGKNRYLRIWDVDDPTKNVTVAANGTEDDAMKEAVWKFNKVYGEVPE